MRVITGGKINRTATGMLEVTETLAMRDTDENYLHFTPYRPNLYTFEALKENSPFLPINFQSTRYSS